MVNYLNQVEEWISFEEKKSPLFQENQNFVEEMPCFLVSKNKNGFTSFFLKKVKK